MKKVLVLPLVATVQAVAQTETLNEILDPT